MDPDVETVSSRIFGARSGGIWFVVGGQMKSFSSEDFFAFQQISPSETGEQEVDLDVMSFSFPGSILPSHNHGLVENDPIFLMEPYAPMGPFASRTFLGGGLEYVLIFTPTYLGT